MSLLLGYYIHNGAVQATARGWEGRGGGGIGSGQCNIHADNNPGINPTCNTRARN